MENNKIQIEDIDQLITDYLSGNTSQDEELRLKTWIMSSKENKEYYINQQELWFSAIDDKYPFAVDKEAAFEKFRLFAKGLEGQSTNGRTKIIRMLMQSAAIIALIFFIGYMAYNKGSNDVKENFGSIEVKAPEGSNTSLTLPDGTIVMLNAGSKIAYSQGFGVTGRNVELEGEAYFEVKHNENLPFTVKSNDMKVTVLGTKFNFRDYKDENVASVSLKEGSVKLNNLLRSKEELTLKPDETASVNKLTGSMSKKNENSSDATGWTTGEIFLNDISIVEAVNILKRNYNVEITIDNPRLKNVRVYASFDRKAYNIYEVLDRLSQTGKLRYKNNGDTIRIY